MTAIIRSCVVALVLVACAAPLDDTEPVEEPEVTTSQPDDQTPGEVDSTEPDSGDETTQDDEAVQDDDDTVQDDDYYVFPTTATWGETDKDGLPLPPTEPSIPPPID